MARAATAILAVLLVFGFVVGVAPGPVLAGDATRTEGWPGAFAGAWAGTVYEYDTEDRYPVELTLRGGAVGGVVGEIAYPAFGCAGDLVLLWAEGDTVRLREVIERSPGCGGDAELSVSLRDGEMLGLDGVVLQWVWFWADGEPAADATLARQEEPATGGAAGSDGAQLATLVLAAATGDLGPALDRIGEPDGPLGRRFAERWSARPDATRDGDALDDALAVRDTLEVAWDGADGYAGVVGDLVDALLGAEPRWIGYDDLGERAPETRDALDPPIARAAGLRPGEELPDDAIRANALLAAIPPDALADALPPEDATVVWVGNAWIVNDGAGALAELDPNTIPRVAVDRLPPEALDTLDLIARGGPFPHDQDGAVFGNREGILPDAPRGHYREYTVETPGESDRGARRIVTSDDGEVYFTDSHYDSFVLVLAEDER